jgi:hypothetical protein
MDIAYTELGHCTQERQAHWVDRVDNRADRALADRARILVGLGMVASRQ